MFKNKQSGFFRKLVNKFVRTTSDSNIGELSKGLFWSIELLEERAAEVEEKLIGNKMISERKVRDFLNWKYGYNDIEEELLLTHMKNNKMIEICKVTIKDENTDEEVDHRAVYSISKIDSNEQRNLKLIELEINLYTLNDAIYDIDKLKERINIKIQKYVKNNDEYMISEMLKALIYSEEVWINVARSITLTEEQLSSISDLTEVTIQLLIRQTRRDIYFYDKWK